MNPVALDDGRPVWNSAKALVLTVAGGATGFGSFYRLPLMFVAFGVGNFMLAYAVCLLLIGFPLGTLEVFLGHHHRRASAGTLAEVHPKAVGVGYAMPLFGSVIIAIYSSVLLGWTAFPFLIESFAKDAPFDFARPERTREYWEEKALFRGSNAEVIIVLAVLWLIGCALAARGIRTIMVAVYFTVPVPLLFLLGLMIWSCSVADGAELADALTPTVDGVFSLALWGNAVGQCLLTVQAATGNLIAFGSFCRPVHNAFNIGIAILVQALAVSIAVGLTTACALTLMDWGSVGEQGYHAGFFVPLAVFASLLSRTSTSGPLAICFFLCVLVLGIENLATSVQVLYSILWDFAVGLRGRRLGLLIAIGALALSVPLTLPRSYEVITAVDQAVVSIILPLIAVAETLVIGYCWADKSILATLDERAVPPGCPRFKAAISIAYHQSVGKIRDLAEAQGRSTKFASVLPFFVKLVIPLGCTAAAAASAIKLFGALDILGLPAFFTALTLLLAALAIMLANAFFARSKDPVIPWTDDVTMGAVDTVGSPTPLAAPPRPGTTTASGAAVGDTLELRST